MSWFFLNAGNRLAIGGTWDLSRTDCLKSTFTGLCKIEVGGVGVVSLTMANRIIDPFNTSIYALKDENGDVLYVGKSENPRQRFSQHIRGDKSGSGDIPDDVRMKMSMTILEKCSKEKGFEREAYWFNQLNPIYNKMRLINRETCHILEKESIPKKPEYRFFSVRAAKTPKPEPKTICECGKTWSIPQKEYHLKQHREMSVQHLAWAAKPSNPSPAEP